jgi:hypothetical protein
MNAPACSCSLSVLASSRDLEFLALTANHLVRQHSRVVQERILVVDDLHSGDDSKRLEFERCCKELMAAGVFTSLCHLGQVSSAPVISEKHFGRTPRHLRDYRGVPMFGWIAGLEASNCAYHVHFDSDILVHQTADFDWIAEGIVMLKEHDDVVCVAPHPGPPRDDGALLDQTAMPSRDKNGNFFFRDFSSRRFLVDRERFRLLLPLPLLRASRRIWIESLFTGRSPLQNWEFLISTRMQETGMLRLHLGHRSAWALHAADHSAKFVSLLPSIIESVERGRYPEPQAGRYDLDVELWKPFTEEASI